MIFEVTYQTAIWAIPILNGNLAALTVLRGATGEKDLKISNFLGFACKNDGIKLSSQY